MKLFLIIILAIVSCYSQNSLNVKSLKKDIPESNNVNTYMVYKIDSINSFYLIYAKKQDTLYKIVSKKARLTNCELIQVNKGYPFILHSRLASRKIGNAPILPGLVNCFYYGDSTSICLEKSIYDLHSAENVKGLCFLKDFKPTGTR